MKLETSRILLGALAASVVPIACAKLAPKDLPRPRPDPDVLQRHQLTLSEGDRDVILSRTRHRLTFEKTGPAWSLSDVEKTTSRLNKTEIVLVLDGIHIGRGDSGLRNLMALVSLMPPNTLITAHHYLSCEKNRWSDKIRALRTYCREQYRIDITCDGAF